MQIALYARSPTLYLRSLGLANQSAPLFISEEMSFSTYSPRAIFCSNSYFVPTNLFHLLVLIKTGFFGSNFKNQLRSILRIYPFLSRAYFCSGSLIIVCWCRKHPYRLGIKSLFLTGNINSKFLSWVWLPR